MKFFIPKTSPKYGLSKCNGFNLNFLKDSCISWRTFLYELDQTYEYFDTACLLGVLLLIIGFLILTQILWKVTKVS